MSTVTSHIECNCSQPAVIRTSWTNENPGRRFHSCRNYKRGGCRFFQWEAPPLCARARAIVPGLLKKIDTLEAKIEEMKQRNRKWQKIVAVLASILVFLCWAMLTSPKKTDI
ncbi:hypothetical protein Salat_2780300 [Sesamum alatum]|uniref:GRF-type domain-containing protein n=1 Tax=Sesamum alatum TaxID=300844 RepID=A0AAE2C9G6_9LAMI|nr:hypothetical protein Salat_2780300 [Sesamum alatum]